MFILQKPTPYAKGFEIYASGSNLYELKRLKQKGHIIIDTETGEIISLPDELHPERHEGTIFYFKGKKLKNEQK